MARIKKFANLSCYIEKTLYILLIPVDKKQNLGSNKTLLTIVFNDRPLYMWS